MERILLKSALGGWRAHNCATQSIRMLLNGPSISGRLRSVRQPLGRRNSTFSGSGENSSGPLAPVDRLKGKARPVIGAREWSARSTCGSWRQQERAVHSYRRHASVPILIGRHVKEALANGSPVVALESTVITHGLPEPDNLELALSLEKQVGLWAGREVTAATIGIVKGQLIVGLTGDEIEYLARRASSKPIKASRRDVPIAIALGLSAGTTVSASMALAWSARLDDSRSVPIRVFATGGIGGVHKGAERSMDVSADLYEFARSPIGVVSSGFKSFLDTRRSLEYMETLGCTVMSLASGKESEFNEEQSALFPGFLSRFNKEAVKSPWVVKNIQEAALVMLSCLEAPIVERRASLLSVSLPEEMSLEGADDMEALASLEAIDERLDLEGKDKTPLMLAQLNRATAGRSLKANKALLENNARVGAELAYEIGQLASRTGTNESFRKPAGDDGRDREESHYRASQASGPPVVVGCTMIDMHVTTKIDYHFKSNPRHSGITFDGWPHLTVGGVGKNLATAIELLGHKPVFITALAHDKLGSFALSELSKSGFPANTLKVSWFEPTGGEQPTTSCFALVLVDSISGQCEYVIANLAAAQAIDKRAIEANLEQIKRSSMLIADANIASSTMEHLVNLAHRHRIPIFIEPTDVRVLGSLVACFQNIRACTPECLSSILCLSPNLIELQEMVRVFENEPNSGGELDKRQEQMTLTQVQHIITGFMEVHLPQLPCLLVTLDKRGAILAVRSRSEDIDQIRLMERSNASTPSTDPIRMKHFLPTQIIERPISTSGAGDSFAAGFISGLLSNSTLAQAVATGFQASRLTLLDRDTVSAKLKNLAQTSGRVGQSDP